MAISIVCSLTGVLVGSVRQSIRYRRMILHLSVRHLDQQHLRRDERGLVVHVRASIVKFLAKLHTNPKQSGIITKY
jgi:hypothetical protein